MKTWLAFAQRNICHHREALNEIGYINWTMYRTNFELGDIVYLFMSDERRVSFKTEVVEIGCPRTDNKYWVVKSNSVLTYKLQLVKEYCGDKLTEEELAKHGFNGGKSIQHPIKNNEELFKYINEVFDED